jgi:SAM-dependent methyltransferase
MIDPGRQAHWENVYATKDEHAVSWFQEKPPGNWRESHRINHRYRRWRIAAGRCPSSRGFKAVTVLDLSEKALATSKARLDARGAHVQWVAADVTTWMPSQTYDVWHDRAALHFLTDPKDRTAYAERVSRAVRPGGHVIIGTFAPDGPERCSGLPVVRYDAVTLGELLGHSFDLIESRRHDHQTPAGATQRFQFSRFRRIR